MSYAKCWCQQFDADLKDPHCIREGCDCHCGTKLWGSPKNFACTQRFSFANKRFGEYLLERTHTYSQQKQAKILSCIHTYAIKTITRWTSLKTPKYCMFAQDNRMFSAVTRMFRNTTRTQWNSHRTRNALPHKSSQKRTMNSQRMWMQKMRCQ